MWSDLAGGLRGRPMRKGNVTVHITEPAALTRSIAVHCNIASPCYHPNREEWEECSASGMRGFG